MLRAVVIDDEPVALSAIKSLVEKVPFVQVLGYFTRPIEALQFVSRNEVDLLFLDIKMPDLSGMEFLSALAHPPMVIFTTAYSEHAVQSFEVDAVDFLLKPFSFPRFLKACNKALELSSLRKNHEPETASIFIKSGYERIQILFEDILYVESNRNYMQFVLTDQKVLSRLTMSEVEALLPSSAFVRIHRSFIAALKKIRKIEKDSVWVGSFELPLGDAYAFNL